MLIGLSNVSNLLQNGYMYFLFSANFAAIFVTIATVKVELIQDFYTLVIALMNQLEQIS